MSKALFMTLYLSSVENKIFLSPQSRKRILDFEAPIHVLKDRMSQFEVRDEHSAYVKEKFRDMGVALQIPVMTTFSPIFRAISRQFHETNTFSDELNFLNRPDSQRNKPCHSQERITTLLQKKVAYAPNMDVINRLYIETCLPCRKLKAVTNRDENKTMKTRFSPDLFTFLSVDISGPWQVKLFEGSRHTKQTYILVIVCQLSRYTKYLPIASTSRHDIMVALMDYIATFGTPYSISIDNQSSMINLNDTQLTVRDIYGTQSIKTIEILYCSPHHHISNGSSELAVKRLKKLLGQMCLQNNNKIHLSNLASILNIIAQVLNGVPIGTNECKDVDSQDTFMLLTPT